MTKKLIPISMLAFMLATPSTAQAQELGKGGLGVDNAASLPKCDKPMATIALVEKKAADPYDKLPEGIRALAELAEISMESGPVQISRESAQRLVIVQANVRGRDLGGYVGDVLAQIANDVNVPPGVFLTYGGQFENQQRAMQRLMIVVPLSIGLIFLMLFMAFQSMRNALLHA